MSTKTAIVVVRPHALTGARLVIERKGYATQDTAVDHEATHHLVPGQEITIRCLAIEGDDQRSALDPLQAQRDADAAAQAHAQEAGQTLAEGLDQARQDGPQVDPAAASGAGAVSTTDGVQTNSTVGTDLTGGTSTTSGATTTTTRKAK